MTPSDVIYYNRLLFTGIERIGDEKLRPKVADPGAGDSAERTDENAFGAPLCQKAPSTTPTAPTAPTAAPPASTAAPTPATAPRAVLGGTLRDRPLSPTRPCGRRPTGA